MKIRIPEFPAKQVFKNLMTHIPFTRIVFKKFNSERVIVNNRVMWDAELVFDEITITIKTYEWSQSEMAIRTKSFKVGERMSI